MANLQASTFQNTTVTSTTNSSSADTGALITSGGIGVSGNIEVSGDTFNISGDLSLANRFQWSSPDSTEVGRFPMSYFRYNLGQTTSTDNQFMAVGSPVGGYNNAPGSGTVTVARESADGTQPNNTGWWIRITSTGSPAPGLGGCVSGEMPTPNAILLLQITARIPVGYTINFASNSIGNNGYFQWLTPTAGTGKWERYVHLTQCGTGSFGNTNYVYLTGAAPVTWHISSWTVNRI
jgi:hypothetical protein